MKKQTLLAVLMLMSSLALAQTLVVGGSQKGVWDADTVLVVSDVIVDESLTVHPGTVVLFDGFYGITVPKDASFEAVGNERDSIVFTVPDTTGFHLYLTGKGAWNGIQLDRAGHFLLDYCSLKYGKCLDSLELIGGALRIDHCEDVQIYHSTFCHNTSFRKGGALNAFESQVVMKGCSLHHNSVHYAVDLYNYGGAACFLKCDVKMREMEFRSNDGSVCVGGALSLDSCSLILDRSVFVDNIGVNGAGLYLMRSNDYKCQMSNLLFDNNFSLHFGGGFALCDVSPEVSNVLVVNNSSDGVSCNGIFFYGHSSPRMTNCIVYGNYSPHPEMIDDAQMWVWTTDGFGPAFNHCLIEGDTNYIHSPEYITAFNHILDTDPMFVDFENHDFRLAPGSPCIDAGCRETPQYVLDGLDLDGRPRVDNQRIDIGPYEFVGASVSEHSSTAFARLIGNPLSVYSRIVFDEDLEGEVTVSVYAMTGRCVVQKAYGVESSKNLAIGELVERLADGVYLIEVGNKNRTCAFKAVK